MLGETSTVLVGAVEKPETRQSLLALDERVENVIGSEY